MALLLIFLLDGVVMVRVFFVNTVARPSAKSGWVIVFCAVTGVALTELLPAALPAIAGVPVPGCSCYYRQLSQCRLFWHFLLHHLRKEAIASPSFAAGVTGSPALAGLLVAGSGPVIFSAGC